MKPKERQDEAILVLKILTERTQKSIDYVKMTMMEEKIQSEVIWKALEYYLSNSQLLAYPAAFSVACEAVGGKTNNVIEAQAAIVMLSAALDLHDDVIDKSKVKHRKHTVVAEYGPDIALLLGNAFLVKGFTLIGRSASEFEQKTAEEILQSLENGLFEAGDAHALELEFKQRARADPRKYMKILEMKAAITETSVKLGALFGGGTDQEIKALKSYGKILGMLAVLREEFIDIFERPELLQRIRHECLPLPILYALKDKDAREIQELLSKRRISNRDVEKLLDLTFRSKQVRKLRKKMLSMVHHAYRLVSRIKNEKSKNLLHRLVSCMIDNL